MAQLASSKKSTARSPVMDLSRAGVGYRILRRVMRVVTRIVFRVRLEGLTNVLATPAVICANHMGWADTLMVLLFLPVQPRVFVVGDKGVRNASRFLQFLVENFGVIQLNREKPLEALRTMKDVLGKGGSLLIFPEGHLGYVEGELLPLEKGAAHVSLQAGVPVLPVGLTGTSKLWVRRHLTMRIGESINPEAYISGSLHSKLEMFTDELTVRMLGLLPGDDDSPKLRLLERWLTKLM
ncbi:MAG: lysophospholipid acyltransferase family protein [Chloroflexia bacterium]